MKDDIHLHVRPLEGIFYKFENQNGKYKPNFKEMSLKTFLTSGKLNHTFVFFIIKELLEIFEK